MSLKYVFIRLLKYVYIALPVYNHHMNKNLFLNVFAFLNVIAIKPCCL